MRKKVREEGGGKRRKRKEKNKGDEEGEEGTGDGGRKEFRCSPPHLSSCLITCLHLNYRESKFYVWLRLFRIYH